MKTHSQNIIRCEWPGEDKLMQKYHDVEWGVPARDDKKLYEYLLLDAFQAGLSWKTVLHKRDNFRTAFDNFDYKKISEYSEDKVQSLLKDKGIIRNRLKVRAAIINAQMFLKIQKEFGSFDAYIWKFVNNKPIVNRWKYVNEIPARSSESDSMSKDLINRGFRFVGSTICYAFMQAAGMINDHIVDCYRYKDLI